MSFIDTIMNWLNKNKDTYMTQIICDDLNKIKGDKDKQLEFALYNHLNKPIVGADISVTISGKTYPRVTDKDGHALLNINLNPGRYLAKIEFTGNDEYRASTRTVTVTVSPRIIAQDFTCTEKAGQNLKALLVDANGTKIDNVPVEFHIVGKTYSRHTDDAGNASLPIRLRKGTYDCTITSYNTSVKVKVTCVEHKKTATTLQGTDLNKKQGGTESYKCRLTYKNNAGKVCGLAGREVQIVLHKVTYKRKTDANGYADLPVNLTAGNYVAHTIFRGDDDYLPSERTNKIVIKKTNKTYNAVRFYQQNNGVNCGPTSLEICSQILGNHISQDKFAEWCNTGSNGTSPADLISGARKGGFKLTEIPRTFKAVSDAIESKSPVIYHHWTGGLSCMNWVNGYGHYAVIYEWSDNPNRFYICDPTKGLGVCSPSAIISASYNFYKVEKI